MGGLSPRPRLMGDGEGVAGWEPPTLAAAARYPGGSIGSSGGGGGKVHSRLCLLVTRCPWGWAARYSWKTNGAIWGWVGALLVSRSCLHLLLAWRMLYRAVTVRPSLKERLGKKSWKKIPTQLLGYSCGS